jgi:hypothetical protein
LGDLTPAELLQLVKRKVIQVSYFFGDIIIKSGNMKPSYTVNHMKGYCTYMQRNTIGILYWSYVYMHEAGSKHKKRKYLRYARKNFEGSQKSGSNRAVNTRCKEHNSSLTNNPYGKSVV